MPTAGRRFIARWHVWALGLTWSVACASLPSRRFPLRDPMVRDTDLDPRPVPCRKAPTSKDPNHISCAPKPYVSPLVWDGADKSIFRPLSRTLAVDRHTEAVNANELDEVPDSAWFTNRPLPVEPSSFRQGACTDAERLDADQAVDGTWLVDQGKANGATPGFRIKLPDGRRFLLKTDSRDQPERPSAASVIGAATYHAAGFFTSCEQIVFVRPSSLRLLPGLRSENNTGVERAFDQAALEQVLAEATKRGDRVRLQASAWLPGHLIGPFRYEGTRHDDPNDVIAHEDRRELRGARLLAAWLDHFDAREQNSMDVWVTAAPGGPPDASPGHVRHYYLDTSDCLGSEWAWDAISRRLGHSYLLDFADIGRDFVTLGIPLRPWDTVTRHPGQELFGYFDVAHFVPDLWKMQYPNPAFDRMTERDGAWMARRLARFTPEMVDALAEMGQFANPETTRYLAGLLEGRLQRILARYLTRLSPLADVRLVAPDRLCATNLSQLRRVRPAADYRYDARLQAGPEARDGQPLPVTSEGAADVCVALPRAASAGDGYRVVTIADGVAAHPLTVHLYDHGTERGFQLAGIER